MSALLVSHLFPVASVPVTTVFQFPTVNGPHYPTTPFAPTPVTLLGIGVVTGPNWTPSHVTTGTPTAASPLKLWTGTSWIPMTYRQ